MGETETKRERENEKRQYDSTRESGDPSRVSRSRGGHLTTTPSKRWERGREGERERERERFFDSLFRGWRERERFFDSLFRGWREREREIL